MAEKSVDEMIADLWQQEPQPKASVVLNKNTKCRHGKRSALCKECGGEYLCIHGRVKRQCKLCGGVSVCKHGRRAVLCSECGGSGLCQHGKQKRQCKQCGRVAGMSPALSNSSFEP